MMESESTYQQKKHNFRGFTRKLPNHSHIFFKIISILSLCTNERDRNNTINRERTEKVLSNQ